MFLFIIKNIKKYIVRKDIIKSGKKGPVIKDGGNNKRGYIKNFLSESIFILK